ncbi:2-polyprenyl-6-hydroxyphenyl methylase / 3-demethylubiquinone-9 3-methyltransferase [Asanoa ishikariensis]|uniref:2-polyprenyl-6-hydroxyphenyl methylase / 3-demethylubiquinone-9 3-methyltransferase n=1 Tax=Asanoa ishikariensis TaxID=137265 RepID=A0A1H3UUW5_9ACTN|nr:methyltransferase domain-containing protein [Asanoa ishikariensis]SDZ66204.1 2-polyprenyl-6-hydroxyphenyl methylase / 3-demethylubiquinone-9 3-methyltransferase [Asanoa ishikariensis]
MRLPRPRNDPRQYHDLAGEWWRLDGPFAMLHWLAEARARLVPPAAEPGAVLVDVGCGAGLLAPHLRDHGYHHVGVDLVPSALEQAASHGVTPLVGDAAAIPLATASAHVVVAGELLEHVPDLPGTVAELCRVLRPGGLLLLDTLNDTAVSRVLAVHIAERMPRAPRGIHDPGLFVDPVRLTGLCAGHGVRLEVRGIRPSLPAVAGWLAGRSPRPGRRRIVPVASTAVLYQGRGMKDPIALPVAGGGKW